jgi:hypothetical protein
LQEREVPIPVALYILYLGDQVGATESPVEERDPVPVPERRLDEVAPEKARAAQDQKVHRGLQEFRAKNFSPPRLPLPACRGDALFRAVDDPIDDAVRDRILGAEYVVAVGVAFYFLVFLARVFG